MKFRREAEGPVAMKSDAIRAMRGRVETRAPLMLGRGVVSNAPTNDGFTPNAIACDVLLHTALPWKPATTQGLKEVSR